MYNSITGIITEKAPGHIVILNNGIEYLVQVSENCSAHISAYNDGKSDGKSDGKNGEQKILTYLHHREDQFVLFGFYAEEERQLFLELLKVSGIGPKQAVRILSGMSPEAILAALENEDIDKLSSIQGLGRKTAQKIILALRGTLVGKGSGKSDQHAELVEALAAMGFDRKRASAALKAVFEESADGKIGEEEAVKRAIVRLSS